MKDITKISCFWVLTSWLADLSLSGNRPVVCVCLWLISWRGRWREKNIVFGCLWSLGQSPYDFERDGLAPCKCHQFSKTCHQVFAELCLHDQCQQFDEPSAAGVSYSHGEIQTPGLLAMDAQHTDRPRGVFGLDTKTAIGRPKHLGGRLVCWNEHHHGS